MADRGLQGFNANLRLAFLLPGALLLVLLLGACGASDPSLSNGAVPLAGPVRITAQWLQSQPGVDLGEFSFCLLSATGEPLQQWRGVRLVQAQEGTASFELRLTRQAPDDLYLYAVYPGDRFAFSSAQLDAGRSADYISLTVAQRIADVAVVGISRLGSARNTAVKPGALLRLAFTPGREPSVREASIVNEDVNSAAVLALSSATGGGLQLDWDERNIGDYDNNSQIGIADLTPVGIHFGKLLAGSAEYQQLLLVDGDENGIIGIGDLTPIGRNFMRYTQGFTVYHAVVDNPLPGDFTVLAKPTVARQDVWDAATPAQRKCRLHYTFEPPAPTGPNAYYVRAYSADGGVDSEGPASNIVSRTINPANQPPIWDEKNGLISATGITNGISLSFNYAMDPESDPLVYSVAYIPSPGQPGDPGTVSLDLPPDITSGIYPYYYTVTDLTPGVEYQITVKVRDAYHDPIPGNIRAARVPAGTDADPWPKQRCDNARTGRTAQTVLTAPLTPAWETQLDGTALAGTTLVASNAGWVGVFIATGEFKRYDVATGALLATHPAPPAPAAITAGAYPVLLGGKLIVGVSTGIALYDLSTQNPPVIYAGPGEITSAPLFNNDVIYTADNSGTVRAVAYATGAEVWTATPSPAATYHIAPCADADYMYVVSDSGALAKVQLTDGTVVKTGTLPAAPSGDALALDVNAGKLYIGSAEDRLIVISATDLSVLQRFPLQALEQPPTAPCLILNSDPPLAVVGVPRSQMLEVSCLVVAVNLATAAIQWEAETIISDAPQHITASSDFIVAVGSGAYLYDFQGRFRQVTHTWNGHLPEDLVVLPDRIVGVAGTEVYSLISKLPSAAPVWDYIVGIKRCTRTPDAMTVYWDIATDNEGQPTYYAIFYSENGPPNFDPPYTGTVVYTDLPPEGVIYGNSDHHSYTINGLDPEKEYYAGVRAYDAPWDASPAIDPNTNWLKATPAWQREELVLGQDLPAGEIFFMRGLTDPHGAMHLVYNDMDTSLLTHVFGATGAWEHEGAGLSALEPVTGFEPVWDAENDQLAIAYARADAGPNSVGIIKRTGADAWTVQGWADGLPASNPQVSLALGPGMALAFTRFTDISFPLVADFYFIRRQIGGTLMDYEHLDDVNYCGRDLDLVLNPANQDDPWVAYQRGTEAVPGRLTPEKGTLLYSRANGVGGFDLTTVDAGVNPPDSDCGKRVQQVLDSSGNPHLAYFDLNASSTQPMGQLKYASYSAGAWQVETVNSFSLHFQAGQLQWTYGELGFGLTADGRAVIAMLARRYASDVSSGTHMMTAIVWVRDFSGEWSWQRLTDLEDVFLTDREPCVLLLTPDGNWHVFFATYVDSSNKKAEKLVHLWTAGQ